MNNTLLTNTTGAKRVFLDLTAGEHTISLTSKQDDELLHDLLVVKYKGEYGKDIIFDKTYEGEQADFNELIGNTSTTVTTETDDDGTTYITGLADKKVTEGGGARQSVVVRESGMYNLEFRYRSADENKINVYVGNTATELSNLVTSVAAPASSSWNTAGAAVYLEKGINIIDVDSDTDIDLDNMRVYEAAADEFTVQAEECIPEGMDELFTKVDSDGAENGTYLAGMRGGDTAKGSGSGITAVISKERTDVEGDKFALTAALTNTGSESRTVKLGAVLNNTEYAEYSNPDVDYPNENTVLSSASETVTIDEGETVQTVLYLDASTLKKPEGYIENEPQPNEGYDGPQRIISDEFFYEIKVSAEDEDGNKLFPDIDATNASKTSAKDTEGQYIEFKYDAPSDGKYALSIFHSNDELCGEHPYNTKIIDRYMNIAVTDEDGNEISDDRHFFINSYSRDTFKEKTVVLDLKEGENTIRMYNDDSVSRWYGGDVAMPSQHRQVNYAPNMDKFVIMPAAGTYDASKAPSAGATA